MWWARWSIWIIGCAFMTSAVIGNAFYQKKQFYPTVVYITKSKPSMAVMYAQALLFVVMIGKLFRKLFFGQLRAAEFEHLVERSWYAVTETCLAFTVFRDDFSPKFLALFTLLLFLKSFHWLAEERVDYMERSPVITWVFHVRVLSLLSILLLLDTYFVNVAYQSTITRGASVQLVFGFEYAILTTIVLNTLAKYVFHVIDMQNETPWENKAVFVLHTEVIIGLFKVVLYIFFVVIMVRIYTLPLFALRPTYLALRAFKKALNDVVMSRRAINNMNNLYPDVTQEELANTDNVCIICREEMTGGAKKLPCNHIFHVSCLRSWFQRQQTCPTCRLNVLRVPTPPNGAAQGAPAAAGAGAGGNFPAPNPFGGPFQAGAPGFRGQQQPQPPAGQAPPFGLWGGVPAAWAHQQQQAAQAAAAAAAAGGGGAAPANQPNAGAPAAAPPAQPRPAGGQQPNLNAAGAPEGPQPAPNVNAPPGFGANNVQGRPPYQFPFGPNVHPGFGHRPPNTTAGGDQNYQFSLPPMPFIPLVPPPPPLLQTTGLSDEELRSMEGTARSHIEARLRCLRNVQILIDSAVVQMQQYTAVVNNLNLQTESTSTPAGAEAAAATSSTTEGTGPSTSSQAARSPTTNTVENQVNKDVTTPQNNLNGTGDAAASGGVSASSRDVSASLPASTSSSSTVIPPATDTSSSVPVSEQEELRRRRLQRFSNPPEAQTQ